MIHRIYNHLNLDYEKKFKMVSKRIEFILEADLGTGLNNNDKVRKSLTDLLKENINLKRELGKKQKEIDRLNEKNNNLNKALERVNKKISTLKNKEEGNNENELKIADKRDALNFLLKNTIPLTLEYRITSLKNDYSSNFNFHYILF